MDIDLLKFTTRRKLKWTLWLSATDRLECSWHPATGINQRPSHCRFVYNGVTISERYADRLLSKAFEGAAA